MSGLQKFKVSADYENDDLIHFDKVNKVLKAFCLWTFIKIFHSQGFPYLGVYNDVWPTLILFLSDGEIFPKYETFHSQ